MSLILGVAGSTPAPGAVRIAGIAGLLAGAFSMAAGELVSVRAHEDLVDHELAVERIELRTDPAGEQDELAHMYRAQGLEADAAATVARLLSANPEIAFDTHARLELGVDPSRCGSARQAAIASFAAFAVGAVIPLVPWFLTSGSAAVVASIIAGALAALGLGATVAAFSNQPRWRTALRQLGVAAIAAGVTYAVGRTLGTKIA
ncbi:MAG: hypothetical protein JWN46_4000 [Acidimicrobiales bacterium]|nr:hypothetical protein [Acidimicrobiales bacterium]